jgi:cytochrome c2
LVRFGACLSCGLWLWIASAHGADSGRIYCYERVTVYKHGFRNFSEGIRCRCFSEIFSVPQGAFERRQNGAWEDQATKVVQATLSATEDMADTGVVVMASSYGEALLQREGEKDDGSKIESREFNYLPPEAKLAESVFQQSCARCHSTGSDPNPPAGKGPPLAGVVGRPAAALPGFGYTQALQASRIVWDFATLDRFLAAPAALVPGTKMTVAVESPADRSDLIAFLMTLRPEAPHAIAQ